jgi:hypothetical protein
MLMGPHLVTSLRLGGQVVGARKVECQAVAGTWGLIVVFPFYATATLDGKVMQTTQKDTTMPDNPLNAQQIVKMQAEAERQVGAYIERLQLRKWALEQALSKASSPDKITELAQSIYDFTVRPANIKIEIGS